MIKLLRRRGKKSHFHVIVNMCTGTKQARDVFHRFAGAVEKYIGIKLNYLGFILPDESLRAAVTMQSPVTLFLETDPSCKNFFRLGQALEDTLGSLSPKASLSAYWHSRYRQHQRSQPGQGRTAAASSDNSKRQSTHTQSSSPKTRGNAVEHESLNKLRTRLLTMFAQGDIPANPFTALIEELNKAVQRVYPDIRGSALAQDNREPPKNSPVPVTLANPAQADSPKPKQPRPTASGTASQHRYNETRFGSQQQLLARLRQRVDQPLIQVLDDMTGKPS